MIDIPGVGGRELLLIPAMIVFYVLIPLVLIYWYMIAGDSETAE